MLPDFRFALGALLAVALIAVAGLGLVTSVRLAREARIGPLDDSRSLAYAGHAEWNQFYDPDGARRFEGLAGKTEAPVVETPRATPVEAPAVEPLAPPAEASAIEPPASAPAEPAPAAPAPAAPEERTASIPADRREPTDRREPEVAPVVVPVIADKAPETDPPASDPPPDSAPAVIAALPAEPASAPAPSAPVPDVSTPDAPAPSASAPGASAPGASAPDEPPAEHVASAPATLPEPARAEATRAPAAASIQPQAEPAPPTPRARPKFHFHKKVVRLHIHHAPVRHESVQNPAFPASNAPWPGYDNQFTGAAAGKNRALASRPQ